MKVITALFLIGAMANANVVNRISIGNYPVDVPDGGLVIGHLPAPHEPYAVPDVKIIPIEPEEELPIIDGMPIDTDDDGSESDIEYLPEPDLSMIDTMPIEVDDDHIEPDVEYVPELDVDCIVGNCKENTIVIPDIPAIDTMPIELHEEKVDSNVEYLPEPEVELGGKNEEGILVLPEIHSAVKRRANEQDSLPIETDPDDPNSNVEYLPEPDTDYEYEGDVIELRRHPTDEQDTRPIETDPDDLNSNAEYLPEPDIDYEYEGDVIELRRA